MFTGITDRIDGFHSDVRQIVYILVFYNISFSWLLPLHGFQVIFLLRDSENDLLIDVDVVWSLLFPSYNPGQTSLG